MQYVVQAQRADKAGQPSPIFIINFGRLPNGNRTATVSAKAVGLADAARWNIDIPAPVGNGHATKAGV